jgi:hypothetical protein
VLRDRVAHCMEGAAVLRVHGFPLEATPSSASAATGAPSPNRISPCCVFASRCIGRELPCRIFEHYYNLRGEKF